MQTKFNKSCPDRPYTLPVTVDITRLQLLCVAPRVDLTFSDQHNLHLIYSKNKHIS